MRPVAWDLFLSGGADEAFKPTARVHHVIVGKSERQAMVREIAAIREVLLVRS
ncbi:hypothetical protein D3C85_1849650 [compost metagenome]